MISSSLNDILRKYKKSEEKLWPWGFSLDETEDIDYIDLKWGKKPSSDARNLQMELYDTLAGVSSLIPPSLEEKVHEKINEMCKKENANMPTKNHEYFMKLLEEAGLKCVGAEYNYNCDERATEVKFRGIIPDELRLNNANKKEYNTMYNNRKPNRLYIKPTGIIRRDDTTRVDWEDGTHTILVRNETSPELDMFYTFCIAFTKKVMGSTGAIMKTIKEHDTDAIEKARKEAIAKANKEAEEETRKLKEEMEKAEFEARVCEEMLCHKVREEAIRRLMAKGEKELNTITTKE